MYRVNRQVSVLGWVDFDLDVPLILPAAQPVLPLSHQPKQDQADGGIAKIKVRDVYASPCISYKSSQRSPPTSGRLLADGLQLARLPLRRPLSRILDQVTGHFPVATAMEYDDYTHS